MSEPSLRIVSGSPTPEELAVVTALVAAAGAADAGQPPRRVWRGGWNDPSRLVNAPLRPGPNAWRTSLR
jgi:hypothetical protein